TEEPALMALLECPLCLEPLDVSAKVLPCQHTFCMRCLQEHQAAHAPSPPLCPDCRAPVAARTVEELPANLLLVRLLEGLRGSPGPSGDRQRAGYSASSSRSEVTVGEGQQHPENQPREVSPGPSASVSKLCHADFISAATPLRHHLHPECKQLFYYSNNDEHPLTHDSDQIYRFQGSDSDGVFVPTSQTPLVESQPAALCKALFHFNPAEINLEDSHSFLSFHKGDVLTVIRRLDEHWIEARLGDKVGVCPLQFTEPNSVAAKLLEGKNRRWSDSAEYYHRTGSGGKDKVSDVPAWPTHYGVPQFPAKTAVINALPTSNQRKQPPASSVHFYQPSKAETSNRSVPSSNHHLSALPAARGRPHASRHEKDTTRGHGRDLYSRNSSTQQLSISVCAVLYSYNPRRPEELELKKGEMVGVYGKFKEGWLRGLSLRTGRVGILPSNYVSPVLRRTPSSACSKESWSWST
uniref:SH3 domain containing ring finger 2 n=1 Tax=Tetraodon nigroviridis TaxID=99883 RepID=H3CU68_TETNG